MLSGNRASGCVRVIEAGLRARRQQPAGLYPVAHPVRVAGLRGHGRVVVKSRKRADRRNTGSAPSPSGPHREAARSPPRGTGSGSTGSGSRWPAPARSCSPGALSPAAARPASSSSPAASSPAAPRPGGSGRYPAQRVAHAEREHPGRGGVLVQALARRVQSGDPRTISPVSFEARRGPLRAGTGPATPSAASPGPSARPSPGPPRTPMRPAPGSRRAAAPAERQLGKHAGGRLEPVRVVPFQVPLNRARRRGLGSRTAVAGGRRDPGPRPRCPEPAGAVVYDAERQEPAGRGLSPSCLGTFGILGPGLCAVNHGRKEERPARVRLGAGTANR